MSKVTCNARERFDGKSDRGEEQTNQSFPSHSVVRLSDLQTNFAGKNANNLMMDVAPQALVDWIGLDGYLRVVQSTLLWRINLR